MSLNAQEAMATKEELKRNLELSGRSIEQVAADLGTSPEHVEAVLRLDAARIEEPWVLRNYFDRIITARGEVSHPYSKLVGDPADYWFLDAEYISEGRLEA